MKPDQERVKSLLTDTVTLLCKNGLQYTKELKVQGLLGITLDNDDVFVVHINEIFKDLLGAQVTGISAGDGNSSAIAAADSATQPGETAVKSRKSIPQKHDNSRSRTSSPQLQGSGKRKAHYRAPSSLVRVKKEETDDASIVVSDYSDNGANDVSEGDREAMRMSYGGVQVASEGPPTKRRVGANSTKNINNSTESFIDEQSTGDGPFITGIVRNLKEKTVTEVADIGNNSLDDSQLSNIGPLREGSVVYDNTAGCSLWDSSQTEGNDGSHSNPADGSQDSESTLSNQPVWPTSFLAPMPVLGAVPPPLVSVSLSKTNTWHKPQPQQVSPNEALLCHGLKKKFPYRRDSKCPDKPFRCQFPGCDKAFYRGPERNRHQKIKHGRIYEDECTPRRYTRRFRAAGRKSFFVENNNNDVMDLSLPGDLDGTDSPPSNDYEAQSLQNDFEIVYDAQNNSPVFPMAEPLIEHSPNDNGDASIECET